MPLLRGKPSKAEQITVSQEMFRNAKANKKKPIMQNQLLFECLRHLPCLSGVRCISQYPNLACSPSCKLLGQH